MYVCMYVRTGQYISIFEILLTDSLRFRMVIRLQWTRTGLGCLTGGRKGRER